MGKDNEKCPHVPLSQKAKYKNRPNTLYSTKETFCSTNIKKEVTSLNKFITMGSFNTGLQNETRIWSVAGVVWVLVRGAK